MMIIRFNEEEEVLGLGLGFGYSTVPITLFARGIQNSIFCDGMCLWGHPMHYLCFIFINCYFKQNLIEVNWNLTNKIQIQNLKKKKNQICFTWDQRKRKNG